MNVKSKLEEWRAAGLITAEIEARILRHEEQQHRPYLLYALGGLGALAIATGVLALIASNWDAIPSGVKLALDLLVAAGLSVAIVRADALRGAWARETLLVLQYGFVLASIGLIAQVYHLGGAPFEALLVWTGLTFFLMSRGESLVVAVIWIIGLQTTYGSVLTELADQPDREMLAASLAYLAPLACIGLAGSRRLAAARPSLARALRAFGWAELALAGSLGSLGFYDDDWIRGPLGPFAVGFFVAAVATAIVAARTATEPEPPASLAARRSLSVVLLAALLASFVPFLLPHGEWPAAAALAFIAFWAAIGWAGYARRMFFLLNLATAMIGLRILIAYFEVLGSLMSTGVALISGGLLTLFLTWLWIRKSKDFKRELAATEPGAAKPEAAKPEAVKPEEETGDA